MAIIGIDLGTTNSLASVWQNGEIHLIPNSFGEFLTPSVVGFDDNGEVFVGKIAKEMLITRPETTFCAFKRNMGTDYLYKVGEKSYRAEELSAFVLRRLKEDAENYLGETITEAVISVPAYFDDNKRCATKNAGKLAGLVVERLINEPSAVALKYRNNYAGIENFIVFDFGGGTLDVSLVEAFDNMVEIKTVAGDNHLGGKDFDEVIEEDFYQKNHMDKADLSGELRGIIRKEAEHLKKALSDKNEVEQTICFGDKTYTIQMTNQNLIHLSASLFRRISKPLERVLNDSEMDWDEIDNIILVGGSSKMPIISQYIKSLTNVPVILDSAPDECVAIGVGMAAAIKERKGDIKDMILADICPFSLGTEIYDGTFSPIIERNDTLPCSRTREYATVKDFQKELDFVIYQGDNFIAKDNLCLGVIHVKDLPKRRKGKVRVSVTFTYDINGILDIKIKGENQLLHKVMVNKNMTLTEEELEKRLKELQQLTLHPIEREENRLLIEKAKRLFQESNTEVREYIAERLRHFMQILEYGKEIEMREACVRFAVSLEALEKNRFHFDDFSEDFWEK